MKYQIRNTTVTFTNRSVNIGDVTGWRWLLDSGSGFSQVGTGASTQDITFPDVGGQLCTVKLVADGPWGSEVKYEEQYTTVENIPGPDIAPLDITTYSGEFVDVMVGLVAGTGAGDLTWELVGPETYGLTVDFALGRIYGLLKLANGSSQTITVKVTDALGRSDQEDIVVSATNNAARAPMAWHDAAIASTITKDVDNRVSAWGQSLNAGYVFTQATSSNQPLYDADDGDGFPSVKVSADVHGMAGGANSTNFIAVLQLDEAVTANKLLCYVTNTALIEQVASGLKHSTNYIPMPTPPTGRFILANLSIGSTNYRYSFTNGIYRSRVSASVAASWVRFGYSPTYGSGGRFRLYELIAFQSSNVTTPLSTFNKIIQVLGEKYNIPVRTITENISV